jgi:hypothetical protein
MLHRASGDFRATLYIVKIYTQCPRIPSCLLGAILYPNSQQYCNQTDLADARGSDATQTTLLVPQRAVSSCRRTALHPVSHCVTDSCRRPGEAESHKYLYVRVMKDTDFQCLLHEVLENKGTQNGGTISVSVRLHVSFLEGQSCKGSSP